MSSAGGAPARLRIGLIGASKVAYSAILAPARTITGVEVCAVAARDPARAEQYAAEHAIRRVHADYESLVRDPDIDLVYVGTPPVGHAPSALAAIASGKHVLVEKPFALSNAEARQVAEAARASGRFVFEAMHSVHHPLFRRIVELVASGEIGALRRLSASFTLAPQPEDDIRWQRDLGGGALMDMGVYPLAWCRHLAGEPLHATRVATQVWGEVDSRFEATLEFRGGVTAEIACDLRTAGYSAHLAVEGDAGELQVDNPLAPQRGHSLAIRTASGSRTETIDGITSYEAQLEAIRATILHGAPFALEPDDYVRSMAAIELVRARFPAELGGGDPQSI